MLARLLQQLLGLVLVADHEHRLLFLHSCEQLLLISNRVRLGERLNTSLPVESVELATYLVCVPLTLLLAPLEQLMGVCQSSVALSDLIQV